MGKVEKSGTAEKNRSVAVTYFGRQERDVVRHEPHHSLSASDRIYRMNMMDTRLDDRHLVLIILFILSNNEVNQTGFTG